MENIQEGAAPNRQEEGELSDEAFITRVREYLGMGETSDVADLYEELQNRLRRIATTEGDTTYLVDDEIDAERLRGIVEKRQEHEDAQKILDREESVRASWEELLQEISIKLRARESFDPTFEKSPTKLLEVFESRVALFQKEEGVMNDGGDRSPFYGLSSREEDALREAAAQERVIEDARRVLGLA